MGLSFIRHAPPDLQSKVRTALQEKGLPGACPVCGKTSWVIAEGITYIELEVPSTRFATSYQGQAMPCVPLVCDHCGHTLLFNLIVLGIWDRLNTQD